MYDVFNVLTKTMVWSIGSEFIYDQHRTKPDTINQIPICCSNEKIESYYITLWLKLCLDSIKDNESRYKMLFVVMLWLHNSQATLVYLCRHLFQHPLYSPYNASWDTHVEKLTLTRVSQRYITQISYRITEMKGMSVIESKTFAFHCVAFIWKLFGTHLVVHSE